MSQPVRKKPPSRCRKGTGFCVDCGATSNGKARCLTCAARSAARGGPGVCRDCRVALPSAKTHSKRCPDCLERDRKRYRQHVLSGHCVCCKELAVTGTFCFRHWLRNIGQAYGFNWKNGGLSLLQSIWDEQKGLCSVTGERLIPGFNASLDHIMPVSKGGSSARSNLRWVTSTINHMKWDLTDEEFVRMCRVVVDLSERKPTRVSSVNQFERSN